MSGKVTAINYETREKNKERSFRLELTNNAVQYSKVLYQDFAWGDLAPIT